MDFKSKLPLFLIFGILTCIAHPKLKAQSPDRDFGLGLMIGEPTGVTVKKWFSDNTAVDIGAAWSLDNFETLHLHSDLLIHKPFSSTPNLSFYYGIGGRVIFTDDPHVGARIPLGLSYGFDNIPFDLFVEAVPILDIIPETTLAGNGAVGIRYYF